MECKDIAWTINWGLPLIWRQDLKTLLSYTLLNDKGNNDYIIRHDLKPIYLCHDIKDSHDYNLILLMI